MKFNVQLIALLIVFGSGLLRWVIVKLQEQAAKKRAMDQVEQRRVDSLRTGRNLEEPQSADPAKVRAQIEAEAAARRQAQIEEFRRRQMERARQRADAQQRGSVSPAPAPVASRPVPPQQPAPAPSRPSAAKRPQLARPLSEQADTVHTQTATPSPSGTESAAPPAKPASPTGEPGIPRPRSAQEWRRAIIASVILSPGPFAGADDGPWRPLG